MKNFIGLAQDRTTQIKKMLFNNSDIIVKNITVQNQGLSLMYVDGLVEQKEIDFNIIAPLNNYKKNTKLNLDNIQTKVVNFASSQILKNDEVVENILKGFAVLFLDNEEKAIGFNVIKYEGRAVEEPPTSTVISGPREGFTENIKINLALIRKRLISPKLKIEDLKVGERTQTAVKLIYFDDLVDKDVVLQIQKKLKAIKIDGILDSYYIATFLENKPNSIFRQVGSCEKPDIACAKLLEGRVAILVDGSPIILTLPFVLFEDFQSSNDYYSEAHRASLLRILRIIAVLASVYLPGMYMAMQLFHYKVLPLKFLVTIVNTTQSLPLNPFLEIFFIIILFDILFEASLRMPRYLGIAVSIVGALILGDTAVKAGLVSPPAVMIIAMSAITIYIIPNQNAQISTLRIIFALIGGLLGFHGLILGTMFLLAYLTNFDSYKTPYLAPFSPYILSDQKDSVLKSPILEMTTRPKSIARNKNNIRQRAPEFLTDKSKKKEKHKK